LEDNLFNYSKLQPLRSRFFRLKLSNFLEYLGISFLLLQDT
jgi:hypothetical protein